MDRFALRTWFQILALFALALFGVPAAASAHGGQDERATPQVQVATADTDQSIVTTDAQFENSSVLPSGHCNGECCCDGPSHCAPCGPSSSAMSQDGQVLLHAPLVTRVGVPRDMSLRALDRKFGLERPPRA
ncbi:exported hypothetical protein [Hyphomicrobium sp. GJ21]|nr:exported hypothetical protein [Hyphomicrobium sp. GJ21]